MGSEKTNFLYNKFDIFVVVFVNVASVCVQTWQMAPCHKRWDSAILLKLVSLRFMHSTLRYGSKRQGYPCMEKGIKMTVSTIDSENM